MLDMVTAQLSSWPVAVTLADPAAEDCPILYANPHFEALTGYRADEAVGRNCRFLQGEGTDRGEVSRLSAALAEGKPAEVCLLNYRKDGSPFHNFLSVTPIRIGRGRLLLVGSQQEFDLRAAEAARAAERRMALLAGAREGLTRRIGAAEIGIETYRMRSDAVRMLVQTYVQRAQLNGLAL